MTSYDIHTEQKLTINEVKIDVTKEEIVKVFLNAYKDKVYTPKSYAFEKIKTIFYIGFLGVSLISIFLTIFGMCNFAVSSLLMIVTIFFTDPTSTENLCELKEGLEHFYWLCDVLENKIRYMDVTELLDTDYIYNSHDRLLLLHKIQNESFKIKQNDYNGNLFINWDDTGDSEALNTMINPLVSKECDVIFGINWTKIAPVESVSKSKDLENFGSTGKTVTTFISEEELQKQRNERIQQLNEKRKRRYAEMKEKTNDNDISTNLNSCKLSLTGDKYDDFRDAYNKAIDAATSYLKEEYDPCEEECWDPYPCSHR